MNFVFYNGEFRNSTEGIVPVNNRGFHYADGFFESIRVINGKVCFFDNHFSRIEESCKAYFMNCETLNKEKMLSEVEKTLKKNKISKGGRLRITFSRVSGGFYSPDSHDLEYFIEAYPLDNNEFKLNEEGKTVDIYPDIKKEITPLSLFKNINSSLYVLASIFAQRKQLDVALIQNSNGTIIEASDANIFIVSNRVLYTPSLSDGCVGGTMRMNVINIALENGLKVYETTLNPQYLLSADEVFLTNAIQGIVWVSSYRSKRYFNNMAKELTEMLNDQVRALSEQKSEE